MSIYIPRHFVGDDATGRALIADFPFATLVTGGAPGVHVTHLPLLLDQGATTLIGHMARPNPHWQAFEAGHTVAVFHGPHAFVSRGWYTSPADNVPTWNYATVHASGRPRIVGDAEARAAVELATARFEQAALPGMVEAKVAGLLRGIVAFHLPIERLEVKLKLSQNKPATERESLMAGLAATGRAAEREVVEWMKRFR